MLTLNDGRNELWQWDTGRKLEVDVDCSQVHFSNKVFGRSIDVDVVDGVATIPDILLQTDKELNVWAFVGTAENGYTKISKIFKVNRRNKPADYVFTPTEQTSLEEIKEKIEYLESIQDPDAIKNAVEDYLEQNPVEAPVKSVNGHTGEVKLTAEDVGAISQDDLQEATNKALEQAKESGEFDGDDYVLTPADKAEIAEMAANLVDIPDSGGNVDLTGYATEQWVKDQKYMTEVPDGYAKTEDIPSLDGYAKTEDIPTDEEIIQLIKNNAPESSGGGIAVTGAKVGQTVKIAEVDENGVPTAWVPADFPSGGGGDGDVWEEILDITLSEDTSVVTLSRDKNGNAFALKKLLVIFSPAYNSDNKTIRNFRLGYRGQERSGLIDIHLDEIRTKSAVIYMDEVQIIGSSHYDMTIGEYETYHIATKRVVRSFFNDPIRELWSEYPNLTYYAGTKIIVWGVKA